MEIKTKEEFIKLYNNPAYTAQDIKRKLGLNNNNYRKLKQETGLTGRRNTIKGKHYSILKNGKISINKRLKTGRVYLGTYNNVEEAETVIKTCEQYNWNINNPQIQKTIQKYKNKPCNYAKINEKYTVYKTINGKRTYYDSFNNIDDAKKCVKLLENIDWNKTVYDNLKEVVKHANDC